MKGRIRVHYLWLILILGLLGLSVQACGQPSSPPIEAPQAAGAELGAPPLAPAPLDRVSILRFEHLTVEDGLSQNAVLSILQDQQGFMWFGTEDGLNKYNGYEFTIYKHDSTIPTTLSDNFVSTIYQDSRGELWIGTRNGLNRLNRQDSTFVRYQHDPDDPQSLGGAWVVSILEDRDGTFWIGTQDGGLDLLDRESGHVTHFRYDPDNPQSLAENTVRRIYQDREGFLWIGTNGGLNRLDPSTASFTRYQHDPDNPQSLSNNQVSAILEDAQGTLWVGTEDGGLNQLDRDIGTFIRYQHDPEDPYSLSHNRVRALFVDSAGRLWIGTQDGLNQLDPQGRFTRFYHDPYDLHSPSSDAIWSIYEDRGGVLWFGTYGGGLSKYNRQTDQFALYQHRPDNANSLSENMVWAISQDREHNLWIGTFNGGLNKLERASEQFSLYQHNPNDPDSLSSDDVRAILQDQTDNLWVGTSGGLDLFNPATGTFTHYRHNPADHSSLSENRVLALHEDLLGNLWVGTRSGGLNRMDRTTGTFVHYRSDPDDPASLSSDRVWALHEDGQGKLWIGTLGGISVWDPQTDQFTRFLHDPNDPASLSNDAVFSFYEDLSGSIWIGTWGGGLDRFDPQTGKFTHFTEREGLPNNVIYGIEPDNQGNLWLSTNWGLSKFEPQSGTFSNYDRSDGLQDNEFNVGAHFRNEATGELFFGGISGFNSFFPERVIGNPIPPPIVITTFSKFNQIIRTDLSTGDSLQISYRDDFISFEFAALDYTAPEKNQYAYFLEGQDPDWVEAGTRRYASYTNLKGGNYTFRVKGSNSDGVWTEEGVAITITVTSPIWDHWWFQGTILLVLAVAALGGYRLRVKSVENRSRKLEAQVAERTQEIRKRTQELEALYKADEELYHHLRLDELLQALVDIAVDILQADKSALLVWNEQQEKLVVQVAHGFSPETMSLMSFDAGEGTVGTVIQSGDPVIVEDTNYDPRVARRITDLEGIRSFMHVPIKIGGRIFGVFNADYTQPRAFGKGELRLFLALAQRAALSIENAQLYERAQEAAVLQDRQRLARDLHDAVTQTLFSSSLIADVLPRLWESDPEIGRQRLEELRQLTRGALAEMRTLLLELRPAALLDSALADLLRQLGESITGRAYLPVAVEVEGQCALPAELKVALYRIAQEALNNVAKHSGASQVEVYLHCQPHQVLLRIHDDGEGFDPSNILPGHLGLGIMDERARGIGASLKVSSQPGQGTEILVTCPCPLSDRPITSSPVRH